MNQMIPSYVFKHRAWKAMKPWMQVLVVIGLLVVLPGLIRQVTVLQTEASPSGYLDGPMNDMLDFMQREVPAEMTQEEYDALLAESDALLSAYMTAGQTFLDEKGLIFFGTLGMDLILTPVLMAPLYGALLDAHRKKELSLPGVFAHLRRSPKMLLMYLWVALRICAWMLPGQVLMVAGVFMPSLGSLVILAGFVLSLVLGIRAGLHYSLAPIVLMDQPETGLNGCIRASWQVMRTRKMEYFMLQVSFVGWHLLMQLIGMLAVNVLMYVIVLTVTMMGDMLLTLYIEGSVVAFWDAYGVRREVRGDTPEFDPQPPMPGDDLN